MLLLNLIFVVEVASAVLVPQPPGPYAVAVEHVELVDHDRIDPFAPEADITRRFMASVFLPIESQYGCESQVVPYMPPPTASVFARPAELLGLPPAMVSSFEMAFCDISTIDLDAIADKEEFPLVVFSPGLGGTRFIYSAMARSLSSLGLIVLVLDHTYETAVVEFPDGSAVFSSDPELANSTVTLEGLHVRTADEIFLISQLSNKTLTDSLFGKFPGTFDPHRVVVSGHSFGGSTAAAAAHHDARVVGGLNFDSPILPPVDAEGFEGKSFVLVSQSIGNDSAPVPFWEDFYGNLKDAKMQLAMRDTKHYAFSDIQLLLTVYRVPAASQPLVDALFGKLDGRRVEGAMNEITVGLVELLFKNRTAPLRNVGGNPDIAVLLSNLPGC
ncbi:1-alkyl-2-acetylglycerophosphocholine esterase like protein [Verticillium longisporum]|nr:1-alkyl-2-acetylglycerophosphocholine esterase like protein [Verticillium longisporum]